MTVATLTSKGQITIPVQVRHQLGLEAGDRVEFILDKETGHYHFIPATVPIESLKGIVPKPRKPVSIEDMNEAIRKRSGYSK